MILCIFKKLDISFRVVVQFVMHVTNFVINYGHVLMSMFFVIQSKMNAVMFGVYLCRKKIFKKPSKRVL